MAVALRACDRCSACVWAACVQVVVWPTIYTPEAIHAGGRRSRHDAGHGHQTFHVGALKDAECEVENSKTAHKKNFRSKEMFFLPITEPLSFDRNEAAEEPQRGMRITAASAGPQLSAAAAADDSSAAQIPLPLSGTTRRWPPTSGRHLRHQRSPQLKKVDPMLSSSPFSSAKLSAVAAADGRDAESAGTATNSAGGKPPPAASLLPSIHFDDEDDDSDDVCAGFTIGDQPRRELVSPRRLTARHSQQIGSYTVHKTLASGGGGAPSARQQPPNAASLSRAHYPSKTDCVRLLAAPPNHRVRIDFRDEFHVEESENCAYDYLEVLDGPFGYSSPIGRYCGTRDPSLIESSGRYLWLRFHSDDSIEYEGFRMVYEFFPATDGRDFIRSHSTDVKPCQFEVDLTSSVMPRPTEGIISSAEIPAGYIETANHSASSVDCTWVFRTLSTERVFFHWSQYKMSTPQICSDSFIDYYERTTSPLDRRERLCEASPSGGDRRMTSNIAYFRLYADSIERVPQFSIVYTLTNPGPCDFKKQFQCGDKWCISKSQVCNGRVNCNKSMDEVNCTTAITPRAQLDLPETVRHHTIIVGVVFSFMLTTAILALSASCHQSSQEQRRQLKMASYPPEVPTTFEMTEMSVSGDSNCVRDRPSGPETDTNVLRVADGPTSIHRGGGSDAAAPTLTSSIVINGGIVNKAKLVKYPVNSVDVTSSSRDNRPPRPGTGTMEGVRGSEDLEHRMTAVQDAHAVMRQQQHSLSDAATSGPRGKISAVATIEKRPVSPLPTSLPSMMRKASTGHRRDDRTPCAAAVDELVYRGKPTNHISTNAATGRPPSTQHHRHNSASYGELPDDLRYTNQQQFAAPPSNRIVTGDRDFPMPASSHYRNSTTNPGWSAIVKPLPGNCQSLPRIHPQVANRSGVDVVRPATMRTSADELHTTSVPPNSMQYPVGPDNQTEAVRRHTVVLPSEWDGSEAVPQMRSTITGDGQSVYGPVSSARGRRSAPGPSGSGDSRPTKTPQPRDSASIYAGTHSIVF